MDVPTHRVGNAAFQFNFAMPPPCCWRERRQQDLQARLHAQDEELAACRESLAQAQAQAQEAEIQARMLDQERARLELTLRETYQL